MGPLRTRKCFTVRHESGTDCVDILRVPIGQIAIRIRFNYDWRMSRIEIDISSARVGHIIEGFGWLPPSQ